jgi:hypothetical protein
MSKRGPGGHHPTPRSQAYNGAAGKENSHQQVKYHFGVGNTLDEDRAAEHMHKKIVKCNTLTVCSTKDPIYYLRLIRHHFKEVGTSEADKVLSLQALGLSC